MPTPLPGAPAHGLASPSSRFSEQQEHPALSQNCFPVHCYASTFHLQHFSGLIFPTLQKRKCTSCSSSYKDSSHGVVLKCLIEQTSYSLGFLQGFLACTPVLLPGKSHGRTSLVGGSPWGRTELDTTERLHVYSAFMTKTD